jgi:predicted nucleic acid-binding protein
MRSYTLDTGALIALERRKSRMLALLGAAARDRRCITVPVVTLVEWWRGASSARDRILASKFIVLEVLTPRLAKLAGDAIAAVPGATAIDAVVMASAAQRGDIVLTSDIDDLEALRAVFPDVRVLGV